MKHLLNRIVEPSDARVEDYGFDGEDGSQMALWTCSENAVSTELAHDYNEYKLVVHGCHTLIEGRRFMPSAPRRS